MKRLFDMLDAASTLFVREEYAVIRCCGRSWRGSQT
jgi:hypothetical protein